MAEEAGPATQGGRKKRKTGEREREKEGKRANELIQPGMQMLRLTRQEAKHN